jgi:hemolysin D
MLQKIKQRLEDSDILIKLERVGIVWKQARELERENPRKHRTRHELEFLPAALEVIETPPSPTARVTVWLIIGLFVIALGWSIIGKTDVVIIAQGKTIPPGKSKVLQSLNGGVVKAIYVEEGQEVKKDQLLVEMDLTTTTADLAQVQSALIQSTLDKQRLELLIDDPNTALEKFTPPSYASNTLIDTQKQLIVAQTGEYNSQLAGLESNIRRGEAELRALEADISGLRQTIPLLQERTDAQSSLVEQGLAPRANYLQLKEQLVASQQSLAAQQHKRTEVQEGIRTAREQREQASSEFKRQRLTELAQAQEKINQLRQDLIKAKEGLSLTRLTAPSDGIVQQLAVTTVGGVIKPAEPILYIVPKDAVLEVEGLLLNRDRGTIKVGDEAQIKVDAYPFTKYGTIPAKVTLISSDSIEHEKLGPVFKIKAEMERSTIKMQDKDVQLGAGMTVTLEIKADERRVIRYILGPVLEGLQEAGREK